MAFVFFATYNFTVWVAQCPSSLKDETVKAIERFLDMHLCPLER